MDTLLDLMLALALGLLVGVERGWQSRTADEGTRLGGIRTFGLIGLLGGLWAELAEVLGDLLLGMAFAAFAALLIVAHLRRLERSQDQGITTVVAALITFALGALAMRDQALLASAAAVLTTFLLSLKPLLHAWLQRLEAAELQAALKLLLISVVMLPVLPNQGFGPWQVLNPYELWWLVVLIAGISFAGYVAVKLFGTGRGILLTGLLGGLTSSTATALHLARLSRERLPAMLLAAGILVAIATMFPRMLLLVAVVNPELLPPLLVPFAAMTLTALAAAALAWSRRGAGPVEEAPLTNPFQLLPAIKFGLFLAAVMLLTVGLQKALGERGVLVAAAVSGLADVDAITLSIARLAQGSEVSTAVAAQGITLAAMVNTLVKAVLVLVAGDTRLAARFLPFVVLVVGVGGLVLWLGV